MSNAVPDDPARRQVLVNLGNRFVVFGSTSGMPEPIHFLPEESPILPRVADESEVAETRIVESLQVWGMHREETGQDQSEEPDLVLVDPNGNRTFVELKVRERDPKKRDLDVALEHLKEAQIQGHNLEVWHFNTERLKLIVMRFEETQLKFDELTPLNVWERTKEGVFQRQGIVDEVENWLRRLNQLYIDVREWLRDRSDLRCEEIRKVTMSEEVMQNFAVRDYDLNILDIIRDDEVIASFVPRGLWLIGAWGRVDVITRSNTWLVFAIKKSNGYEWQLVTSKDRQKRSLFDRTALLNVLSVP